MTPNLENTEIPTYRIDLAQPPELRYVKVAEDFSDRLKGVMPLFDEVLQLFLGSKMLAGIAKFASRFFLRRVYDEEQTKEIAAIARVAGVDLHPAIALNAFLDLMLGCTSGAALVRGGKGDRLLHFRTLEWGMDILRELLVVLEFVDSRKGGPEQIIARSITYAGFVGVLTGVRKNLSLSLNFRPNHDCKTSSLLKHQLLVLLGYREAVPSILRRVLLTEDTDELPANSAGKGDQDKGHPTKSSNIAQKARKIASTRISPCYLTLCDGTEVAIIQKDLTNGRIKTSERFMIQTNHDVDHGSCCGHRAKKGQVDPVQAKVLGDDVWLEESEERLKALHDRWIKHVKGSAQDSNTRGQAQENGVCLDTQATGKTSRAKPRPGGAVSEARLLRWVKAYPTTNECSHFSCIMDPTNGEIRWLERGPDPAESSEASDC